MASLLCVKRVYHIYLQINTLRITRQPSLIVGEFLVNPLIMAEHDSPPPLSDHAGCGPGPPLSIHDALPSMTGTIFASCPTPGAIVCRAVSNQAMLEPVLRWV